MAFCIKSTDQFSNSRYWTEDGVPAIDSIVSPTKYSTESEATTKLNDLDVSSAVSVVDE